ncbi:MAG: A/G-specific adenine glycosylase [Ruminiclostridium sp.]|nr:A/G-specific adenine glycosylase [Ruminiclostridium sp.]
MNQPLSLLPIPLLDWYRDNARDLPWRREPTPYRVLVSEIMLQQTRVAAVLDYFARFMEVFPTVRDLADAPEDQLMKLWQGLGYYSRARNLQKAARQIITDWGGKFPTEYKDLRALAGVGEYTAAALASIAFGRPVPAVDGNLLRVSARIMGDSTDVTTAKGKKHFTEALREIIPLEEPGRFNQAMMDLGATVCLPNGAPLCRVCPAADFCCAHLEGRTEEIPVRPAKKARRVEDRVVWFFFNGGRVAIRRRPDKGLLAGLWEYPNEPDGDEPPAAWGLQPGGTEFAGTGVHIFTHVEWHMTARKCYLQEDRLPEGWVWADKASLRDRYAVPSAFAPFRTLVEEELV